MFVEINWTIFLYANSDMKADEILQVVKTALDDNLEVTCKESYWKDKALYKVMARTKLFSLSIEYALFDTLELCKKISSRWVISPPSQTPNKNVWEFHGSIFREADTLINGIKIMDFYVLEE